MKKVALEYLLIYIIEGFHKWNKSHHCDFRKKKKIILSRWGKIRWIFPAIGKSNKETGSQRWKIKMVTLRGVADTILLMVIFGKLKIYTSWGRKESDMTEWLNWTELKIKIT